MLFTIVVLAQLIFAQGDIGYELWAGIFAAQWMKFVTFGVIIALVWSVLVGVRDVWMDYVQSVGLRLTLQVFTIVFGWSAAPAGVSRFCCWRLVIGNCLFHRSKVKNELLQAHHQAQVRRCDRGRRWFRVRASLELSRAGLECGRPPQGLPTRSHTVAAQGGVSASLRQT